MKTNKGPVCKTMRSAQSGSHLDQGGTEGAETSGEMGVEETWKDWGCGWEARKGKKVHPLSTVGSGLQLSPGSLFGGKPPTSWRWVYRGWHSQEQDPWGNIARPSAASALTHPLKKTTVFLSYFSCFVVSHTGHTRASLMGAVCGFGKKANWTKWLFGYATLYLGN